MATVSETSIQTQTIALLHIIGVSILGTAIERRRWPRE